MRVREGGGGKEGPPYLSVVWPHDLAGLAFMNLTYDRQVLASLGHSLARVVDVDLLLLA